ncbi:glycerophosphodiester phosphodiesterase family protein [Erythrobacter sp. Alg231-14]|uniref:glycerophosphodiester phosphodiesterase family protein n=1 Tax=Erythrobacter sp. Alg231-14 TaxID=1922225 RepID=UPI000D55B567
MTIRTGPQWFTRHTYAHRGLHSRGVIENSKTAMEQAVAVGFGIECDIQMSADKVPLVFHDWDLDRLTGDHGSVADHNATNLCQIRLKDSDDTIWTLADLLELVGGKVPILVEVKSFPEFDIDSACAVINDVVAGYSGALAVMSFDPRMGEWFAQHSADVPRGLVCTDTLDHGFLSAWRQPGALERASPDFLAIDVRDLPNAMSQIWRETGRPLLTWTVRTQHDRAKIGVCADAAIAEGDGIG